MSQDYYELLGVSKTASADDIKRSAYASRCMNEKKSRRAGIFSAWTVARRDQKSMLADSENVRGPPRTR